MKVSIRGIIRAFALLFFLIAGFLYDLWHPCWVVFPIIGIGDMIFKKDKDDK